MDIIAKVKIFIINNLVLKNIFNTRFQKNILISYTIVPFLNKKAKHTNNSELKIIAKIFNDFKFNVDVIHYTSNLRLNYKKYNLIFGFGEPFENSFVDKNLKRIYYATGAHVCHQNYAEIQRVEEVNTKYNSNILPKRLVPWTWSLSTNLSDSLIVIGNDWTKSTYQKYTHKRVFSINATAFINESCENIVRDIEKTKKSFLWFGSGGLIHKGLDLCLEYFGAHSDLILHICGPMEDDFNEVFGKYFEKENIFYHGFTNVNSQKFIDIVSKCSFSIFPTCSEGQATALLTTMGAGLIPISTKYSGVDIADLGFLIYKLDLNSIDKVVQKVITFENLEIEIHSKKLIDYIQEHHTLKSFENNLKGLITKAMNV